MTQFTLWAAWSPEAITVYRYTASIGSIESQTLPRQVPSSHYHWANLRSWGQGVLLNTGAKILFASDGWNFEPFPSPPPTLQDSTYKTTLLPDGKSIAFLDYPLYKPALSLYLWQPGDDTVRQIGLPKWFDVHDVNQDASGRLWLCGQYPTEWSKPDPDEYVHAFAISADHGATWQIEGRALGSWRTSLSRLLHVAPNIYQAVYSAGEFMLLRSEYDGLYLMTTYLFVYDGQGRWFRTAVVDDTLSGVVRSLQDELMLVFHDGMLLTLDSQRGWRRERVTPKLRKALQPYAPVESSDVRIHTFGAAAAGNGLLLIGSVFKLNANIGNDRLGEGIVYITNDQTEVISFHDPSMPEIVTICSFEM